MRWKLLALLVVTSALAVPALALADDAPSAAAAACKAEYIQLGADAFKARYGATEPYGNCLKAHGGGTPAPSTTPPAPTGPEAICKAEYVQLGADAFKARYGATETFGACVKAHGGTSQGSGNNAKKPSSSDEPKKPNADPGKTKELVATVAQGLCLTEGKALGKDAFQAKYGQGKDGLAACAKAALGRAQSIVAGCKTSATPDAFKQCVLAALKSARAH